ncbi:hypothetical protein SDC9_124409 [bioreactor metagenome]|uniref:Uncharacterized protein n=1 Tax=bioreactor metagenome TaxID=1076179 RepID=A0A645CKB4_9ZZZZ
MKSLVQTVVGRIIAPVGLLPAEGEHQALHSDRRKGKQINLTHEVGQIRLRQLALEIGVVNPGKAAEARHLAPEIAPEKFHRAMQRIAARFRRHPSASRNMDARHQTPRRPQRFIIAQGQRHGALRLGRAGGRIDRDAGDRTVAVNQARHPESRFRILVIPEQQPVAAQPPAVAAERDHPAVGLAPVSRRQIVQRRLDHVFQAADTEQFAFDVMAHPMRLDRSQSEPALMPGAVFADRARQPLHRVKGIFRRQPERGITLLHQRNRAERDGDHQQAVYFFSGGIHARQPRTVDHAVEAQPVVVIRKIMDAVRQLRRPPRPVRGRQQGGAKILRTGDFPILLQQKIVLQQRQLRIEAGFRRTPAVLLHEITGFAVEAERRGQCSEIHHRPHRSYLPNPNTKTTASTRQTPAARWFQRSDSFM